MPKPMHYPLFAVPETGIYFKKLQERSILYLLVSQEPIKGGLLFTLFTHLMQVALESAHSLYNIEPVSTNKQAILLKHLTCCYHLLERWRHHFGVVLIGIRFDLLDIASCLCLYHCNNLHISTIDFIKALSNSNFSLLCNKTNPFLPFNNHIFSLYKLV